MNNWKQALAVILVAIMAFIIIPLTPKPAYARQIDLMTRVLNLENFAFGGSKTNTTVPVTNVTASMQNGIANAQLDPAIEQYVTGSLTATQIDTMFTTPITLIPDPGANQALIIAGMTFIVNGNVTTSGSGGVISLVYHGAGTNLLGATLPATVMTSVANGVTSFTRMGGLGTQLTLTPHVGVDITNATGVFTGNSTVKYYINYRVHNSN